MYVCVSTPADIYFLPTYKISNNKFKTLIKLMKSVQ